MLVAKKSAKSKRTVDIERLRTSTAFLSLARFFEVKKNFELAEMILAKKKKISLRVVEYVAANSRRFFFNINSHGTFRDKLDSLGKKNFDIFRRSQRFEISLDGRSVTTNLSQLRFFRHCISSGVIEWLLASDDNVKQAELAMKCDLAAKKRLATTSSGKSRKKRKRELRAVGASNVTFAF